jgi:hypothetical protein
MAGRALRRMALLVAVAAVVAACGPSGPSPSGGTSPGNTASTGPALSSAGPASSGTQPVLREANAIEQVVYFLEGDSTGTTPTAGTTILLMFEPGGRAVLYATSESEKLGHHGTWRYDGGQLSLKFTAEDFKPDATFGLNLADTTVTMPFLVFDTGQGTSTWKRGSLSLVTKTNIVFHADAMDPDSTLSPDEAIDEAVTVAQGMAESSDPNVDVLPLATRDQPAIPLARMDRGVPDAGVEFAPRAFDSKPPQIKNVTRLDNGLHVEYENAPAVDVALFDMSAEPTTYINLVPGPIASDPRVRLDPEPSGHSDDPANKKAVLIAPFSSRRYPGGLWTAFAPDKLVKWAGGNPGYTSSNGASSWYEPDAELLSKHGYAVSTVVDDQATLANIIAALGGPSGTAPGLVIIQTHGDSTGNLTIGVDLGPTSDMATVNQRFAAAVEEVSKTAPDFVTFEGGTAAHPKTVEMTAVPYEKDEFQGDFFLALTPAFWRWLKSHGVRFDNSLVFIAACSTDASPDLREAISAKAYFAWSESVYASLDRAVASYIVDSMVRPTHTAEEAYYNIARVISTGQRIYDEDQDFQRVFANDFPRGSAFLDFFRGYGWNGSTLVPYATNGWFDPTMNPGNVWWLVFAGRWDKKAGDGAAALAGCEKDYWQDGKGAGLRDAFCNSAAPGGIPTPDEVAYATFVLTGKKVLPYSGTPIPRLTLADGQS